jgi:4-amino-4-deoxy-L-arabinose transferase-like glycosyltransferase
MLSGFIRKYAGDIRFWIILAFIVRLYGIWQPPLEVLHNWRQVTGNMVARNFLEVDNNIMFPRLDFAGEKSGITGTEFPVLNYLMYLFAEVFGWQHWYGRLINLIVSSLGIWFFFKVVSRVLTKEHAFYASFILLFSIWFTYSRKSMPDTFSSSLCIAGLWYGIIYTETGKILHFICFTAFAALGVLSKLPAIILLSPMIFFLIKSSVPYKRKMLITFSGLVVLAAAYSWYYVQVPCLNKIYGFSHYYFGTSLASGYNEIVSNIPGTLEMFYFVPLMFSGFVLFMAGLFYIIRNKNKAIIYVFAFSLLLWIVFMMKSGRNFWVHGYYITPFVPFMALVASEILVSIKLKIIVPFLLLVFTVESIANQQHDFVIHESDKYRLTLESIADKYIPAGSLVIINGGDNPRDIYFLHRKGWSVSNVEMNPYCIDYFKFKGADYLVIDKNYNDPGLNTENYKLLYEDKDYNVFSLVNH